MNIIGLDALHSKGLENEATFSGWMDRHWPTTTVWTNVIAKGH